MKICEYVPHGAVPDIRGFAPAIVAQNFARFLADDEVYLISNKEDYDSDFCKSEYGDVHRIAEGALYRRLFRKITRLDPYPLQDRAAKIVSKYPVDIFHAHQLEFDVNRFKKKVDKRTKIAVHAHITKTFDQKLGTADCYLAVSEYLRGRLIERGYDERLVKIVRNGVDTDVFRPLEKDEKTIIKQRYGIDNDQKVVVFVGRKQEIKGFEIFLEVADRVLEKSSEVCFLAVGSEPNDAKSEKSYAKRQLLRGRLKKNKNYIELNPLKQNELSAIYQISDIALLPSKAETQGMAILEAMSSECVVVSSANSAIVESIDGGTNGILIENPHDIDSFFSAVESLLNDNPEYLGINARKKILETFSWGVVTKKLNNILKSI